ncbi:MAG TPA: hypothetical protein VEU55_00310 [Gemmatimonadales bacterium]|nr:hypothetical protein [Gemmatimonadales bacterium]
MPRRVAVELDAAGRPAAVTLADATLRVETVCEMWRLDDEWWRHPIARRYAEVVLEGGKRVVLFEDLNAREWFLQR